MTNKQLQKLLKKWQHILRLDDWIIEAKFAHQYKMSSQNVAGHIAINEQHKNALIELVFPEEIESPQERLVEAYLIHELLHIYLEGWEVENDTREYVEKEQALNMITSALYRTATAGQIKWLTK